MDRISKTALLSRNGIYSFVTYSLHLAGSRVFLHPSHPSILQGTDLHQQNPVSFPIHSLPFELISTILILAADDQQWGVGSAISLSAVCRRWRRVATRTAPLWSSVELTGDASLRLAKRSLQRSAGYPFDVVVDISKSREDRKAFLQSAMECLKPHIGRCALLSLRMRYRSDAQHMIALLAEMKHFPMLRSFQILVRNSPLHDASRKVDLKVQRLLRRMQNLQDFGYMPLQICVTKFPNLRSLTLYATNAPSFNTLSVRRILSNCSGLQTFHLHGAGEIEGLPSGSNERFSRITLPSLQTLCFTSTSTLQTWRLLTQISTPSLKKLSIHSPVYSSEGLWLGETLSDFVSHQGSLQSDGVSSIVECSLAKIGLNFRPSTIARLLDSLLQLDSLHINDCGMCNKIIDSLLSVKGCLPIAPRCPRLQYLHLENCRSLDQHTLSRLVESRRRLHESGLARAIEYDA